MADVAALVFEIDAAQARGAAKALTDLNSAAIKAANSAASIGTTMRDANGRFQQAARLTAENLHEVKSLAKAYNPLIAAQIRYRDEAIRTSAAVKAGVISDKDRATYLKRLKSELDGTASAERKAASAREAARREFLPLYAASKEYEATLGRLNAALKAGDISAAQHAAALKRINDQYASSAAAVNKFSQSQQVARHHVSNLSFQLNDIGMMMAMGQNPFMLMMQQGPQVAQILSQMNAEGRKIGPTLAGAFKMFLNPTTAVTLAVIGLTAALGQMVSQSFGSGDSVKTLADALDNLDNELSNVERSNKSLIALARGGGLDDLRDKYGAITGEVRAMIEAQNELDRIAARSAQNAAQAMLERSIGPSFWSSIFDNGRVAVTEMEREAVKLERTIQHLQNTLGITGSDAEGLARTLKDAFDQKDPAEYARLIGHVRDYLLLVAQAGGKGADEALRLAQELTKSEEAARRVNAQAGAMPGAFSAAAASAARITDELNRAVSAARNLALSGIGELRRAQIELEFRGDAVGLAGALAAEQFDASTITEGFDSHLMARQRQEVIETAKETARLREQITALDNAEREAARSRSSRGGGGGGGAAMERKAAAELKAAEKGFQNIRELLEKESLFQVAEWEKRQKQLDVALAKDLVTRENYELMKQQLQRAYFGTEYEQQNLRFMMEQQQLDAALEQRRISEERYAQEVSRIRAAQQNAALSGYATFFGNMAQAAQAGGDRTSKIVKAFSIAQGILNSYLAYTQVLADPSLMGRPFLRTALAASTLAAGLGAVARMKSGGGGSSSASAAVKQEPTRNVLVRMEGPDWMQDIAESVITQIFDQSKDGRVIISRDY